MAANTTPPLVSVVTPFHNTEAYLGECIESVLAQTFDNWEYTIVDNQSTDASVEIAMMGACGRAAATAARRVDRKSTRLNSSHRL